MLVHIVQSKQNGRLKELRRALASPSRGSHGLIGIEGPHLVGEARRAGVPIRCIFAAQGTEQELERLALPAGTEVLLMARALLNSALATESPQPIAALVEPPDWTWSQLLARRGKSAGLVLVLAELQDPGNLGTIVRSAEAFGADGVLCLPGTVSPWNPKAIRASAGSVFRVPVLAGKTKESIERLRESGLKTYAAMANAARPVDLANLVKPVALMIGNEGSGVSEELVSMADGAITIPCPGPVESLNAAVAASLLLYEASRQRSVESRRAPNHRDGLQ
jgi:TrmH family RNA methyltransferase